eukprot:6193464-Pleurochrysis_carterae.AAC.7
MASEWAGTPVQAAAASGELLFFYKTQAEKLQAELAHARRRQQNVQSGSLPLHAEEMTGGETSWSLDPEALPPLIRAYDERIGELQRSEKAMRSRAETAEARLRETEETNAQLSSELQSALEASLRREAFVSSGAARYAQAGTAAELSELKSRLEVLFQENDVLTEQAKATSEELDRLRAEKLAQAQEHMALVQQLG